MKRQRVILTGFGFMGQMHAQALAGIPEAEIVAIVDTAPDLARDRARRCGLTAPMFPDLGAALRETDADIVNVCLPTDQHAPAAIAALRAGKHVFCEKPVTLNLADARKMQAAHRRAGTFVQVGQCVRFWPEYQAFEQFVRAGTAGRLLSLTMQRRSARPHYTVGHWINDARRSLGAALDLHIHDTDYVLHLLGAPRAVRSRGVQDGEGWNHIFTDYAYDDVIVQAEGGWNYPAQWGFQMAFQAVFERGTIEYDSTATPTLKVTLDGNPPAALPFVPAGGTATGAGGNIASLGGYANELRYFIDCVQAGRPSAIATLDQAVASLQVVLAEMKSVTTGRPVNLKAARA